MNELQQRIDQFRKMATDDPDNELGHYRLGQLLMEAGQYADAAASLRRTIELSPQFSKAFQLLATCYLKLDQRDEAVKILNTGYRIADEAGNFNPRDEMGKMLQQLGEAVPAPAQPAAGAGPGEGGSFRCQRPGCLYGNRARQLARPPFGDDLGR